jgi:hypothetical protein
LSKHRSSVHVVNPPGVPDVWSVQIRAGDPLGSNVRAVCTKCNNAWLSAIQDAAKPLLIPMLTGQTCVLGETAQTKIATWAAMATTTAEHLMHEESLIGVPQVDREWLWKNGTPPPDWRIWIGRYQRHRLPEQWTHCSVPIYERGPVIAPSGLPQCNTQTTTFMVGELFVHVLSGSFPHHVRDWDWRTWPRAPHLMAQIWPIKVSSVADADACRIARAFFGWVDAIGRAATTGLIIRP